MEARAAQRPAVLCLGAQKVRYKGEPKRARTALVRSEDHEHFFRSMRRQKLELEFLAPRSAATNVPGRHVGPQVPTCGMDPFSFLADRGSCDRGVLSGSVDCLGAGTVRVRHEKGNITPGTSHEAIKQHFGGNSLIEAPSNRLQHRPPRLGVAINGADNSIDNTDCHKHFAITSRHDWSPRGSRCCASESTHGRKEEQRQNEDLLASNH